MARCHFKPGVTVAEVDWKIATVRTKDRAGRARTICTCASGHWHPSFRTASNCNDEQRRLLAAREGK